MIIIIIIMLFLTRLATPLCAVATVPYIITKLLSIAPFKKSCHIILNIRKTAKSFFFNLPPQ